MAFFTNNRYQPTMFPPVIDDYVPKNSPVRVYDAFVEALNLKELGFKLEPNPNGGAYEYYAKDMLKLVLYGYSYGATRSSRKLERACHDNLSFIWLMGGLKPDYRTIARFRSNNKKAIRDVLKQCVHMCIKMDLIEGNLLFVDGSKFRANASIHNTWTKERCQKYINKIEKRIDELLDESEKIDIEEQGNPSLVELKEEVKDKNKLVDKMKEVLKELRKSEKKSINSTDKDCVKGKSRQGTHAIYNVQNTVDHKHGLIVNSECVSQSNDYNQLSQQATQATEILGKPAKNICADAGYADVDDLEQIDDKINIIVPNRKQAQESKGKKEISRFDRSHFIYHEKENEYECPAGERLTYRGNNSGKYHKTYCARGGICKACQYYGECTKSKKVGRKIIRLNNEKFKEKIEQNYLKPENQKIYALRKQTVEHPFGHLKKNLGVHQFLLRGKAKVNAEIAVLSTCFNIRRLMTIVGIPQLIAEMKVI